MFNQSASSNTNEKVIHLPSDISVVIRWLEPKSIQWHSYQNIFISAFSEVFNEFSAEELDMRENNKTEGFLRWFQEEVKSETKFIESTTNTTQKLLFLEIEVNKTIIGYSIWHWLQAEPTQVYHSSLCLLPQWQGKGIGTQVVIAIKDLLPMIEYFIVDTRKSEKNKANHFYREHLKCQSCPIVPDETLTNPDKFIGYKGYFSDIMQLLAQRDLHANRNRLSP